MNVGDVIDRIYRDYLLPPTEQPARFAVGAGGIDESSETLPAATGLLSPEESDLIGPGTIIEAGAELMLVTDVDDAMAELTVRRRMYGTKASAHPEGTLVTLAPEFPRQVVFDALCDSIEALWPDLWQIRTEQTYTDSAPVALPRACEDVLEVRVQSGRNWQVAHGWEFLAHYPLSPTGKAIQFPTMRGSGAIHVVYRAAPIRPESEDQDLAELNVDPGWVKVAAVGAVAHVVANEDIDRTTVEWITQAFANEGFEIGQGSDVRNSLLQYQSFLLGPLRRSIEARSHTSTVVVHPIF